MKRHVLVLIGIAGSTLMALAGCRHEVKPDAQGTADAGAAARPPLSAQAPTAAAHVDAPFEGEIDLAVYEPNAKNPVSIAYDIKGDKVRSATAGGPATEAHVISDLQQRKAYAVVDASKSYAAVEVDKPAAPANAKAAPPVVSKTGKTEKVGGRDCEDWVITQDKERFDLCVAKGIAYFDPAADAGGGAAEPAWAEALRKERAFPLRVVATSKDGKQEFRAEATKIEAKKLDDGLFKVPTDYKLVPMSKAVKVISVPLRT